MFVTVWDDIRSCVRTFRRLAVMTTGLGILGTLAGGVAGLMGGGIVGAIHGEPVAILDVAFYVARAGCIAGALVGFFGTLFEGSPVGEYPPLRGGKEEQRLSVNRPPHFVPPGRGRPATEYGPEAGFPHRSLSQG
jgi:hypothetical protein